MNQNNSLENSPRPTAPSREAAAYASLSELVYADQPVTDSLKALTGLAKQVLSEAPDVSLTLIEGERTSTPAYTGERALELDGVQYDTRTGPCLDAARFGEAIALTIDPGQLYPEFCGAARDAGVTHTLSIGLTTGDHPLGALNVYSSAGAFSENSDRMARTFATCVGILLANVDRYRQAATMAANLEVALQSRAGIDQAKGILMARHRCSGDGRSRSWSGSRRSSTSSFARWRRTSWTKRPGPDPYGGVRPGLLLSALLLGRARRTPGVGARRSLPRCSSPAPNHRGRATAGERCLPTCPRCP